MILLKLQLIYINHNVVKKYQEIDSRVLNNYKGRSRPYLALLLFNNKHNIKWAIPLSSPSKNKLNKKLENSPFVHYLKNNKNEVKGILQFNNMIPIKEGMYERIEFLTLDKSYSNLLKSQYLIIRNDRSDIFNKVARTFEIYEMKKGNIKHVCDFMKLAEKCIEIDVDFKREISLEIDKDVTYR